MICWVLAMEMLQGVWKQHLRPRAVGYGVKIFLPSPPNYVTKSPGWGLSGRDPFNQNFRKFRSKTQWIGSVQPEKFRKNGSTFWGGPLLPVGPVGILVEWIAPSVTEWKNDGLSVVVLFNKRAEVFYRDIKQRGEAKWLCNPIKRDPRVYWTASKTCQKKRVSWKSERRFKLWGEGVCLQEKQAMNYEYSSYKEY